MSEKKDDVENVSLQNLLGKRPQFTRGSPLDGIFGDLYENVLFKIANDSNIGPNFYIYQDLGFENDERFVQCLLSYFVRIHKETKFEVERTEENNLLPISLHDMRYLEALIRLIIIYGIDANLPSNMKIRMDGSVDEFPIPKSHKQNSKTLSFVLDQLYPIYVEVPETDDYVRSIMLKGPLYQRVVVGLLNLSAVHSTSRYESMSDAIENVQQTYHLFSMYTLLVQTIESPHVRRILLAKLSVLPVRRDDGVLSLIDFITGAREDERIDLEKINRVSQVLVAKPRNMSSVTYFSSIFRQILVQLAHINRPVVVTCLNDVISVLYRKNPRIIQDFLFKKIYEVLFNIPVRNRSFKELNDTINVLISLAKNPSLDVIQGLTSEHDRNAFYLHIWVYALFLKKNQKLNPTVYDDEGEKLKQVTSPYYSILLSLLKSYIVRTNYYEVLNYLSLNLLNYEHIEWKYVINLETQLAAISIQDDPSASGLSAEMKFPDKPGKNIIDLFKDMDLAVDLFITLLKQIDNNEVSKNIFLSILTRCVKNTRTQTSKEILGDGSSSSALVLIDLKILERMNKEFTSEIVKKPTDVLIVIDDLIDYIGEEDGVEPEDQDSDDESGESCHETNAPDTLNVFDALLQLLTTISNDPTVVMTTEVCDILLRIDKKLARHNHKKYNSLHEKISNLLSQSKEADREADAGLELEREQLHEALGNINDPLETIRVQGLNGLLDLVRKRSTVVAIGKVLSFHLQFLRNSDPYIYLNAIKGLASLCEINPEETLDLLLKIYLNLDRKNKTDDVLKVGEALIRYIQRENELFQGKHANAIIDACLSIVRQQKSLDNRIRMSAISILGVSLQVNALGIQDRIALILDCAFGILQLETGKTENEFVVRRAAIHLIHDLLMHSAGPSLLPDQYSPQELSTLLHYVKNHDEDFLVQEQADDILREIRSLVI